MQADATPVIDARGISKAFDGVTVVDQISLQVNAGDIFGFLGPNGSGKTTFLRMLCGLLTPDGGGGTCLGFDIRTQSAEIKRRVGYMTQRFSLYADLTVRENLDFAGRLYELANLRGTIDSTLERFQLASRHRQLAGTLSGGWKQRLALACCMLHEPQLLLLDEPTAGVDPRARREFWEAIHHLAASGITVLVTTHYMDEAERCHHLGYIAYGKLLAQGGHQDVIRQAGLSTWEVAGPHLMDLAAALRALPAVQQVTPFGRTLHVSGTHPAQLESDLAPFRSRPGLTWKSIAPGLEDAFIGLMRSSEDNMKS